MNIIFSDVTTVMNEDSLSEKVHCIFNYIYINNLIFLKYFSASKYVLVSKRRVALQYEEINFIG